MNHNTTFQIYNASAGSGKTFTLVREYLKLLLASDHSDTFKQVLAITFTNKAVNEMKERVVSGLREIADENILSSPSDMFLQLREELGTDDNTLHLRAKKVLKRILHNYAFFDISTIDKFNHRLLRTFAHDLQLPVNFEVAIDTVSLLNEAVDRLIYQAGEDKLLTRVLVDFALEKADEDKSWDISLDLKKIARLLLQENHYEHIREIENKTLADLKALSALLKKQIQEVDERLAGNAGTFSTLMDINKLEAADFTRRTIPNFFLKAQDNSFKSTDFQNKKWQEDIRTATLYTKATEKSHPEKASIIDGLQPQIADLFEDTATLFFHGQFLRNFRSKLIPLSLLNAINQELNHIKETENLMPISEFNRILAQAITDQPAPFIYERLGEKYRHYFIDEFQDTSEMQWKNLQPLIGNALEGESLTGKKGSLLLVGDAKQAIYRWRGGKAEQFIALYNRDSLPFQVEPSVEPLPVNYRSYDEIIRFNNRFFRDIAEHLTLPEYKDLYLNKSHQEANSKKGGLVNISFVDKESEDIREAYCNATLRKIETLRQQGHALGDICILTRKKDQGALLAGYLQENDIPVISSESLLLKNHPKVSFLINLMHYFLQPENREVRLQLLAFLAEKENREDKHGYFSAGLRDMCPVWESHCFSPEIFLRRSLYDGIQYAIACFGLNAPSDAYLQYFLDEVLEQVNRNHTGPGEFLDYWEKKKDTLGIVAPEGIDAVQIMTIHKSKGLQFPVVIFPFAETNIYEDRDPLLWFPVNADTFGIPYALISKNKDLVHLNKQGENMVAEYDAKLELDSFNILYVALTRAVEQLHIIAKTDMDKNGKENTKTFSGLFIRFLKDNGYWEEGKTSYNFPADATISPASGKQQSGLPDTLYIPYVSNITEKQKFRIITRSGALWSAGLDEAIETGNVYHSLLSRIVHADDLENVIREAIAHGTIPSEKKKEFRERLLAVTTHPQIGKYYTTAYTIYNEKDIFTAQGEALRPDRVAIDEKGTATILDYKTGSYDKKYERQLQQYQDVLTQMGYMVREAYLVFIDREIRIFTV
ncbi:UvrD-helicase domain-containing protein [Sinomicrobium weinanense]|uniref:DNA 3'-5' helicase n=1 Tax=Sinomicrobium weinanense TaxID=2842200 RepID=A0A926Q222_9FLAO|nr:UvrD-helicase domain-containing protein [Sinomicrobium weinanense]MBC9794471.1 UvrD-helicase domain-containing protein [Sinomicrobium weinanense]MBU3124378.1 UvrD-helicase domain-containing protein [Sinomicrobium weinanense]